MNIRFFNARILTMEENCDIFEGELWVKDNLIFYCGTAENAPKTESFEREINLKRVCPDSKMHIHILQ